MKLHTRSVISAAAIPFMLMLMLITMALPGKVSAVTGSINSCNACHNYPPDDSVTRNPATGAFPGNHGTHFSSNNCQACHNSVGASEYNHSIKSSVAGVNYINMTGTIHRSRMGTAAKYNKGVKFAQSSTPTLSNCSNVNCHFESATPTWGQASPWSSTKTANNNDANCAQCHASTGLSSGRHAKHISAGGGTLTACSKCHPDYNALAGTAAFSHTTSVGSPITINFSAAPNLGGTYAGGRTGSDYLPSAAVTATGTCSALYCHSPGNKASSYDLPNTSPVAWNGTLSCKGCHKSDFASGDNMMSGSHERHVGSAGKPWYKYDCVRCHAATVNAGLSIKNVAKHVNAGVDLAFDSSSSAANGTYKLSPVPMAITPGTLPYGGCGNVYCHSNGQNNTGTGITYKNPVWGNSSTGSCGTCHDVSAGFGHGTTQIASGKHTLHLSYGFGLSSAGDRCTACHDIGNSFTVAGCSNSCHSGTSKHVNNQIDIIIPSYFGASANYSGTPKPGDGYGSCGSVYCHSDGQATPAFAPAINWAASGPLACTACHGSAAVNSPGGTPLSGKHAAHVNPAVNTGLGIGNGFGCVECHQRTVASNTTLNATSGTTVHVNKFVEYTGLRAGGPGRYNSVTKQCSNFYCHSNAKAGTGVAEFKNPPVWNSASTLGCNGCHGNNTVSPDATNPTSANLGQPNYTNGGAGLASANSHKKHVIEAGMSNSTGCYNCHAKTVDKNVASRFRPYSTTHVSGGFNIAFSPAIGGTYTPGVGSKTCATTACHGAGTPQWGGASLLCNACHSANNSGYWAANSSHRQHWEDASVLPASYTATPGNTGTATTYMFQCSSCHATTAAHSNLTNAASTFGAAEVFFGYTSSNRKGSYSYAGATAGTEGTIKWTAGGNCSTTYCHSNGNGNNPVNTSFTWNSANGTLDCGGCHDKAGDASWSGSAAHKKHVTDYIANTNITCNSCHALTASSSTVLSDKTKHVNKIKDLSFNTFAAGATVTIAGAQGSQTCANTYCHSNGTSITASSGTHTAVSWAAVIGCSSCHDGPATGPTYSNGSPKTNSHAKHTVAANNINSVNAAFACVDCHSATVNGANAINDFTKHVNKVYDVSGSRLTTYTYASNGGTCSTSCHAKTTPKWGESSTGCNFCHPYDVADWSGSSNRWGGSQISAVNEGFGAHAKHISHIKGLVGIAGSMTLTVPYGSGHAQQVCGSCHPNTIANHIDAANVRTINFGDATYKTGGAAGFSFLFDPAAPGTKPPLYNGSSATSSLTARKTCSNIACHFYETPVWSNY